MFAPAIGGRYTGRTLTESLCGYLSSPLPCCSWLRPLRGPTCSTCLPGNAADTCGTVGDGAVNYVYKIDAYKVTTAQYTQFLNAIAKADTYNLWNSNMSGNYPTFGI